MASTSEGDPGSTAANPPPATPGGRDHRKRRAGDTAGDATAEAATPGDATPGVDQPGARPPIRMRVLRRVLFALALVVIAVLTGIGVFVAITRGTGGGATLTTILTSPSSSASSATPEPTAPPSPPVATTPAQ